MGITFSSKDGEPIVDARASGYGAYLDHWAITDLARGDAERRQRFLRALGEGGFLLFSMTNAGELAGPQGGSADAIRSFLADVRDHWIPLAGNPFWVADRECSGVARERAAISESFVSGFVQSRAAHLSPDGVEILDLSSKFFDLAAVVDWVQQDRDTIRGESDAADGHLKEKILQLSEDHEKGREYPPLSYDLRKPAYFALQHLLRLLVVEAKAYQLKKGDAADLCHAVLGSAYASVATLDQHWKRRVEQIPGPHRLARVFSPQELDALVDKLEELVS